MGSALIRQLCSSIEVVSSVQAVLSGHTIVVYEVALSVSRLVRKHAPLLHPLEWDLIYSSLAAIQDHLDQLLQVRTVK